MIADALRPLRARLQARWGEMAMRERVAVTAAAALVAVALLWLVGLRPALRSLDAARSEAAQLESQWQTMQRQAAEARRLRSVAAVAPALAAQALQGASERLGAAATLTLQGDQAVLTLRGVPPDALLQWLAESRSAARARPVEAELSAGANGLAGRITLQLGAEP